MSDAKRTKDDKAIFLALFPSLVEEIIAGTEQAYPDYDKDAMKWFRESLNYNCLGGKMNRGLSVMDTFRCLVADPSEEALKEAAILGWCVEWLQAFFLVADDLMDSSITRRGQPCWYKRPGVGTIAVNDSFLIEAAIYRLLKTHFRTKPYYTDLVELMLQVTYETELGQMLDLITAPEDHVDLTKFSLAKYKCIVKYKTAFYSFYLPVAMAMMMSGITEQKSYDNARVILLEMGEFFQIQDDYLDCYGAPEVIGKIGTDIEDNKCSWLVVQALDRATPAQRETLEAHYGKKDHDSVAVIKSLYKELNMEKIFRDYEDASYSKLVGLIEALAGSLPSDIFLNFAKKIYKRDK